MEKRRKTLSESAGAEMRRKTFRQAPQANSVEERLHKFATEKKANKKKYDDVSWELLMKSIKAKLEEVESSLRNIMMPAHNCPYYSVQQDKILDLLHVLKLSCVQASIATDITDKIFPVHVLALQLRKATHYACGQLPSTLEPCESKHDEKTINTSVMNIVREYFSAMLVLRKGTMESSGEFQTPLHAVLFNVLYEKVHSLQEMDKEGKIDAARNLCETNLIKARAHIMLAIKLISVALTVNEPEKLKQVKFLELLRKKLKGEDSKPSAGLHANAFSGKEINADKLSDSLSIDAVDEKGLTPLMYAAIGGQTKTVLKLLASGASPNIHDASGSIPLHVALLQGNLEMVMGLVNSSSRATCWSEDFFTPSFLATFCDSVDIRNTMKDFFLRKVNTAIRISRKNYIGV